LATVAWQAPDGKVTYAAEGSVFIAGAAVQWLRDQLGIIQNSKDVEALANTVSDSGGVTFVPALTGLGAPFWNSEIRGSLLGLTRGSSAAHIAYAALESIAFQVAAVVDAMIKDSGKPIATLRVDGGAAANGLLLQIQADLLDSKVVRARNLESTGLGAGLLAGLGKGLWSSLSELRELNPAADSFSKKTDRSDSYRRWLDAVAVTAKF
jgi:glycerol kinase